MQTLPVCWSDTFICCVEETQRSSSKGLVELIERGGKKWIKLVIYRISTFSFSLTHTDARRSRQTAFFSLIHLPVHRSPSTFPFPRRTFLLLLLPQAPASLPSPLPLRSVYHGILMWPVRELVKLSQLCASGCQGPFASRRRKPAPAGALLLAACWQISRGGLLSPPSNPVHSLFSPDHPPGPLSEIKMPPYSKDSGADLKRIVTLKRQRWDDLKTNKSTRLLHRESCASSQSTLDQIKTAN